MAQTLALYMGSLILRSIGIALVAGVCTWKLRNVAMRHAVWVVVLGAVLAMPALDYLLPASWVPARIQQLAASQSVPVGVVSVRAIEAAERIALAVPAASTAIPNHSRSLDWWKVAAVLYVLVTLGMFTRLALGFWKMLQLRRAGRAISSSVWDEIVALHRTQWRFPVLLESDSVQVPMTVGLVRPAVILPIDWKTWDEWKLRAVLLHEVAHIRRGDWGIAVVAAAVKCAYWLDPLVWFLERKLSQLAEQACDDATLRSTQNPTRYAEILLEFAAATQNSGRLMKGGVAMARHNMKARIERALGSPIVGTGIVKITGWVLVMTLAVPVIYVAAALQVASEPTPAPAARYVAEFGRNHVSPVPPAAQQAAPVATAAPVPQPQQKSALQASEPRDWFQMELESQKLQRQYVDLQAKLLEAEQAAQTYAGASPDPQRNAAISGTLEFLRSALEKMEAQMRTLQVAMRQQSPVGTPSPSALLDLPDNDDNLRVLTKLSQLRENSNRNSFSVSVTGIQGRTISMKVAGQDYSLGCESCSFFVGESEVGSVSSTPSAPGVFVRLSSDGRDLYITCHAEKCRVAEYEVQGDGTQDIYSSRLLESGLSELFRTSKRILVVIFKN